MPLADWLGFRVWALLIGLGAALIITGYAAAAVVALVRSRDIERARLVMADGVITGLGALVAASLLKMIVLESWNDIGLFAVTLSLRTLLKQLFSWEQRRLQQRPARHAGEA